MLAFYRHVRSSRRQAEQDTGHDPKRGGDEAKHGCPNEDAALEYVTLLDGAHEFGFARRGRVQRHAYPVENRSDQRRYPAN